MAQMFGTSRHVERPNGLVVEHYVMSNLSTHWPITPQVFQRDVNLYHEILWNYGFSIW